MKVGELNEYPDELLIEIMQSNLRGMIDELYEDCSKLIKQHPLSQETIDTYGQPIEDYYEIDGYVFTKNYAISYIFNAECLPKILELLTKIIIKNNCVRKQSISFIGGNAYAVYEEQYKSVSKLLYSLALKMKNKKKSNLGIYESYYDILKAIYKLGNSDAHISYGSINNLTANHALIELAIILTDWDSKPITTLGNLDEPKYLIPEQVVLLSDI